MNAEHIRAARGLLRWNQTELAHQAEVSVETIKRLEAMDGPILETRAATLAAIEEALTKAGVEFLNHGQPGVRLVGTKGRR